MCVNEAPTYELLQTEALLTINKTSKKDTGEFICKAVNDVGETTAKAVLIINRKYNTKELFLQLCFILELYFIIGGRGFILR